VKKINSEASGRLASLAEFLAKHFRHGVVFQPAFFQGYKKLPEASRLFDRFPENIFL